MHRNMLTKYLESPSEMHSVSLKRYLLGETHIYCMKSWNAWVFYELVLTEKLNLLYYKSRIFT